MIEIYTSSRENSDKVQMEVSEEKEKFRLLETFTSHDGGRWHTASEAPVLHNHMFI